MLSVGGAIRAARKRRRKAKRLRAAANRRPSRGYRANRRPDDGDHTLRLLDEVQPRKEQHLPNQAERM